MKSHLFKKIKIISHIFPSFQNKPSLHFLPVWDSLIITICLFDQTKPFFQRYSDGTVAQSHFNSAAIRSGCPSMPQPHVSRKMYGRNLPYERSRYQLWIPNQAITRRHKNAGAQVVKLTVRPAMPWLGSMAADGLNKIWQAFNGIWLMIEIYGRLWTLSFRRYYKLMICYCTIQTRAGGGGVRWYKSGISFEAKT